jgi:hypothetical protein
MKRLRWWTMALIVQLAVFYNLERLDLSEKGVVNIEIFPYVLALIAVVATLAIRPLSRISVYVSMVLWAAIYIIGHWLFTPNIPLIEGMQVYLLVTELAMLELSVLLAYRVTSALQEFAQAVEQVTVPDPERWVLEIHDAADAIRTEINRSRRYQRPLSVLVVEPLIDTVQFTLERIFQEVQRGLARHYAVVGLGRLLKISLRRTDVITLEDRTRGRFIVLCPETDHAGSTTLVERIKVFSKAELGFAVVCGSSLFPEDALTFEDAVRSAVADMQSDAPSTSPLAKEAGERGENEWAG